MFMRETRGLSLESIAHTEFKRNAPSAKNIDDVDSVNATEVANVPGKLNAD
jgi:hypothetical protein